MMPTLSDSSSHWPRVTVVSVCRNALRALQSTAATVAALQYPALEYIVRDGASLDGTLAYLRSAECPTTQWVSEPDKGIYDAMNKGVERATGEWVIFMNAGDGFHAPDVLQRLFSACQPAEADVIYGDVVKQGRVKPASLPYNAHKMFFCHQSVLVRTELLRQFPFDTNYKMSADFKQVKQLFKAGKRFVKVDVPVADFDTSGVSNAARSAGLRENIRVVREVDGWLDQIRLLPRLLFVYYWCKWRGR